MFVWSIIFVVFPSCILAGPVLAPIKYVSEGIPGRYIVKFKDNVDIDEAIPRLQNVASAFGARFDVSNRFRHVFPGFSAELSYESVQLIRRFSFVDFIEEDGIAQTEQVGWNLDRIDQRSLPLDQGYSPSHDGNGANIYVLDTGVNINHVDIAGRAFVAYDALGGDGIDCSGHGSHCAGVAGGTTYGVAKGAHLYSVRVLSCSGSGAWSNVIADFLKVVKTLEALPDTTTFPVMINIAGSVDASSECSKTCDSGRSDNLKKQQTMQAALRPPKEPTPQALRLQTAPPPQKTPPAAPRPQESTTSEQGPELHILTHWEDHQVKALLGIIKDKDKDLLIKGKNKKAIWKSISEELSNNLGVTITSDQCYDKFRNIKQSLRKHEDRRRKTGNGQPKPFKYPDIYDIVGDDPSLQPTYTCDSEGNVCDRSEVSSDSDCEETTTPSPKKIKSQSRSTLVANEMREMYKESQKQLQETLLTMHNQNREFLKKLIEKL